MYAHPVFSGVWRGGLLGLVIGMFNEMFAELSGGGYSFMVCLMITAICAVIGGIYMKLEDTGHTVLSKVLILISVAIATIIIVTRMF